MKRIDSLRRAAVLISAAGLAAIAAGQEEPRISAADDVRPPLAPPAIDDVYAPVTEIPEDLVLIEGDILVPRGWTESRSAFVLNLWPGGTVPFEFGPNVTSTNRDLMRAAMDEWESLANVNFIERSNQADYIFIRNATFNASEFIGRAGGEQRVFITSWTTHGTLVHELGHVLGFWHEQSRADRDNFVDINFNNVCQNCCTDSAGNAISCNSQFTIRTSGAEHGPYDFGSVMHYGACAFSNCGICTSTNTGCRTIDVLPPNDVAWQGAIGQRVGASYWDGRIMHFLYPESNWRFADSEYGGLSFGTFTTPWTFLADALNGTPEGGTLWLKTSPYTGPREFPYLGRMERPMRIETTAGVAAIGR